MRLELYGPEDLGLTGSGANLGGVDFGGGLGISYAGHKATKVIVPSDGKGHIQQFISQLSLRRYLRVP